LSKKILDKKRKKPEKKLANSYLDFELFPKPVQNLGSKLVDFIQNNREFEIHENGEISIENKKLKNSNIHDLIDDLLRDRKREIPTHGEKFIRFLSKINLPQTFIKNKNRLHLYKKYKGETTHSNTDKPSTSKIKKRKFEEEIKFLDSE
jgi:hypothetical protein